MEQPGQFINQSQFTREKMLFDMLSERTSMLSSAFQKISELAQENEQLKAELAPFKKDEKKK